MPGIDSAFQFASNEAKGAIREAKTGAQTFLSETKAAASKSAFNVPGQVVASGAKESLKFGAKMLIKRPIEWVFGISAMVLKTGIKTGLQLASLIPIPLPGGSRSIAQVTARMRDFRLAIHSAAQGDVSFKKALSDIQGRRLDRQQPSNDSPPPTRT